MFDKEMFEMLDQKNAEMRRVCGWCGKFLGTVVVEAHDRDDNLPMISHGICDPCSDEEIARFSKLRLGVV